MQSTRGAHNNVQRLVQLPMFTTWHSPPKTMGSETLPQQFLICINALKLKWRHFSQAHDGTELSEWLATQRENVNFWESTFAVTLLYACVKARNFRNHHVILSPPPRARGGIVMLIPVMALRPVWIYLGVYKTFAPRRTSSFNGESMPSVVIILHCRAPIFHLRNTQQKEYMIANSFNALLQYRVILQNVLRQERIFSLTISFFKR